MRCRANTLQGRGWSVRKPRQGLFSSTLYPGTDLDRTERLEPSFLGVAALSLDFGLPWKASSWLSGGLSPSETLPEELSCSARGRNKVPWNQDRSESHVVKPWTICFNVPSFEKYKDHSVHRKPVSGETKMHQVKNYLLLARCSGAHQ